MSRDSLLGGETRGSFLWYLEWYFDTWRQRCCGIRENDIYCVNGISQNQIICMTIIIE